MINIKGKNKAEVLALLYNASKQIGLRSEDMTVVEAQKLLDVKRDFKDGPIFEFDYLRDRVMKVDLSGDEFDPWLYDRSNGEGAAARALGV